MPNVSLYNEYYAEVLEDGKKFIKSLVDDGTYTNDTDFDEIYDDMFTSDEVCRNASQYNTDWNDHIDEVIFDKEIMDGLKYDFDFGVYGMTEILGKGNHGRSYLDCTVRCWMLGNVSPELEDYFNKLAEEHN